MKLIWKRKTKFRKIIRRDSLFLFKRRHVVCLSPSWSGQRPSIATATYNTLLYQCLEWHSGANSYARRWERRSTRHFLCVYTDELFFFLFFFKLMVGLVHSSESRNHVHLFIFLYRKKKNADVFLVLFGRLFSKRDCQHSLWLVCWLCTTTTTWNSSHANVDPSERSLFFHPGIFYLIYISSVFL